LQLAANEIEHQPSLRYPSSPWTGYAVAGGSAGEQEQEQEQEHQPSLRYSESLREQGGSAGEHDYE
jgi:hypothetical protein